MGDSHKLHSRDRLSELNDSLIITILSFLHMRDAVRTSVLSKRWIDRWTTLPSLNFSRPGDGDLDRYRSFVYGALLRWEGVKILRFSLPFSCIIPPSPDLDSWLLFAIGKQVEELGLWGGLRQRDVDSYYFPPQRLYTCSSIRKLNLSGIELRIPGNVQLSQLTSLTVMNSKSPNESGMTRLLSGAPVLEELVLMYVEIGENYDIRSESLKKLRIGTRNSMYARIDLHSAMRIWAPNLSTLEIGGYVNGGFSLDVHVPSLTTAILGFDESYHHQVNFEDLPFLGMFDQVFRSIRHAQSVTLSKLCIKLLLHLKKKGMSVEFSNAKYLKIYPSEPVGEMVLELLGVVEMFPKLLTLAIVYYCLSTKDVDSFSASENKIDIPLRHLNTCEMTLSAANSSILRVVEAVLENGEMLEKMVHRLRNGNALGSGALEKVLSMRRSSPKARVIISKDTT